VRALGLSEVSAATLGRAQAVHPIVAVQSEYSPWTRNPEIAVLEACRRIGAAFVAFSPTGRGLFTDAPPDPARFDPKDIRLTMPRFGAPHWPANLALRAALAALADEAGLTLVQLALAWGLARGEHVVSLPGTTSLAHLRENLGAAALRLDPGLVERIDALVNERTVSGERYSAQSSLEVDTERF
jgi:aryl-alcohol dehydrogenase-like predicted oxidoreductase